MVIQDSNPQDATVEKEIRFAVVMYGGVSLAIYINGVAQELHKLVRATARKVNEDGSLGPYVIENPDGTERVYRELGNRLKARFVIDILSGTSAGGINAVYLAKALANHQSMSDLENLWVQEGDIKQLLNDQNSIEGIAGLRFTPPPTSLLNSDRMYYRLLEALDKMDRDHPRTEHDTSPFVDELDLYITATDIRGLALPITLADTDVHEYRYRTVFRFYYSTVEASGSKSQDFLKSRNPFLAFAARATSSFPFAFQPIKLGDIRHLLDTESFAADYKYDEIRTSWSNFHSEYRSDVDNFYLHSFGDGGYLDNKPFSFITETLRRRRADIPVDRRLFYIEPAPEGRQDKNIPENDRPNAVENVLAATVSLPRYETIRDDLLQIKNRNDLIERSNNMLRQVERTRGKPKELSAWIKSKRNWRNRYLDELLPKYRFGYAAYHQLRMAETLDDFAEAMARNIGIMEDSKSFSAFRQIIDEWRTRKYSASSTDRKTRVTENELLFRMDMSWRLRRLYFLLRTIDNIMLGLRAFRTDLKDVDPASTEPPQHERTKESKDHDRILAEQLQYARELVGNSGSAWEIPSEDVQKQYFEILSWMKRRFNEAYVQLRSRGRRLRQRNLASKPNEGIDPELASYVRGVRRLQWLSEQAANILNDPQEIENVCNDIEELSYTLAARPGDRNRTEKGYLHQTLSTVSALCERALKTEHIDGDLSVPGDHLTDISGDALKRVQECLQFYYDHFEYYDMLTFPIKYATPIGESDLMEVYRISPADASGLMPETPERRKLAGTKLGNFGAFFKKEWRENDILWGRLDGAERIISTLLPDSETRTAFLVQAWLAILNEKEERLGEENVKKLHERLGDTAERVSDLQNLSSEEWSDLRRNLSLYFKQDYTLDMTVSSREMLDIIKRSISVASELFEGLVQKSAGSPPASILIAKLGRNFTRLIQYVMPDTRESKVLQRGLAFAYLIEIFLIVVGLFGIAPWLFWLGIFVLLLTVGFNLTVRYVARRLLSLF